MEKKLPRYIDIAIDIATKIKKREIKEGMKLKGRSLAAAQYNVSTETMRKAFILLANQGIVEVKEKSGVFVISRTKAVHFLNHYKQEYRVKNELSTINDLIKQKKDIDLKINKSLKSLSLATKRKEVEFPIEYFSIQVHNDFDCCNKTVESLDFFNLTGATLFGIVSGDKTYSHVNPYYIIKDKDILYFSGEKNNLDEVLTIVKKSK